MSATDTAALPLLWELFEFDPDSRPHDKEHGCGQIWELPRPPKAVLSLAYCRMRGPSQPHYNTRVYEMYVPVRGRSLFVKAGEHRCRYTEIGPGDSVHAKRNGSHAVIPIDPIVDFYLVTNPPYQSDGPHKNEMMLIMDGVNWWDEKIWLKALEKAAQTRGVALQSDASVRRRIERLVEELTVTPPPA